MFNIDTLKRHLPDEWGDVNMSTEYTLEEISPNTQLYQQLESKISGYAFKGDTLCIVRIKNPYLYLQFKLKKEEYTARGCGTVLELFHDTDHSNIHSIAQTNLDWRRSCRVKYGKGVSFSPSPAYANQESSRSNSDNRAMIIADVLIGNQQTVNGSRNLPSPGYDTTVGNGSRVYVKYYDNEFYPKYAVSYINRLRRRRRW